MEESELFISVSADLYTTLVLERFGKLDGTFVSRIASALSGMREAGEMEVQKKPFFCLARVAKPGH